MFLYIQTNVWISNKQTWAAGLRPDQRLVWPSTASTPPLSAPAFAVCLLCPFLKNKSPSCTSWNQTVMDLWQSQNRTQACACPWASWLPVFPKTALKSQSGLKEGGRDCLWGPHLIALPTPACREVEAILTMKAEQNNNLLSLGWQLPMTDIKMSPIHVMDLASPGWPGPGLLLHSVIQSPYSNAIALFSQPAVYLHQPITTQPHHRGT